MEDRGAALHEARWEVTFSLAMSLVACQYGTVGARASERCSAVQWSQVAVVSVVEACDKQCGEEYAGQ